MSKKDNKSVNNPHDKMFKSILSKKEEAQEFLIQTLPERFSNRLNYNSLKLSKESFVNSELQEYFADIVYTCNYFTDENKSEEIKISLIFEHKSYPEEFPHLQLLMYMTEAWKQQRDKKAKKLQAIIPIIFYHGKKDWEVLPFEKYFTYVDDIILEAIPKFNYHFVNAKNYDNEQIFDLFKDTPLKVYFLLAKNIPYQEILLSLLKRIFEINILFDNEIQKKEFYRSIIYYLLSTSQSETIDKIDEIMKTTTYSEDFVTVAESLILKGRNQGILEGRNQGILEGKNKGLEIGVNVFSMIAKGFDDYEISEQTGLSIEQIQKYRITFMNVK